MGRSGDIGAVVRGNCFCSCTHRSCTWMRANGWTCCRAAAFLAHTCMKKLIALRQKGPRAYGGRHRQARDVAHGRGARVRAHAARHGGELAKLKSPKGNPLEIARIAGIAAAKRTSELIPLCHPLALTHVDVSAKLCQNGIEITSEATATGPTGVEMEALVAASVAALTIYDMCKALERGMEITELYVVKKSGGRSGVYERPGKRGSR